MQKKKTENNLEPVLAEIDIALRRQNSLGFIFVHGFIRGMGTALGATVLVALITSLTLHFAVSPQTGNMIQAVMASIIE